MNKLIIILLSVFIVQYGNAQTATLADVDGNVYNTVPIGTQVWMKENLRTTKYKDNTAIPLVIDNNAWSNQSAAAYCWYNNNATTYKSTYGALYNWYTVQSGKLCPTGWRVPSESDWAILISYLGGEVVAGGKLKEVKLTHWSKLNTGATNTTGFTALPSGSRDWNEGMYAGIGEVGSWWSTTKSSDSTSAWVCELYNNSASIFKVEAVKSSGMSVRCLKDTVINYTTGVNRRSNVGIELFPNPSSGRFTILFGTKPIHIAGVAIYNMQGCKVFSNTVHDASSISIDLTAKPKGVYLIKIMVDGVCVEKKLVKQ